MHRIILIILLFTINTFSLTSCSKDAREIDEMTYIVAFGLDLGVSDILRVSFEYSTLSGSSKGQDQSGGDGKDAGYKTVTIDAPSIARAFNIFDGLVSKHYNLTHTNTIFISEEFARNGYLDIISSLTALKEMRTKVNLVVVKGKAMDYMNENKPLIGTSLNKSMTSIYKNAVINGYIADIHIKDFLEDIKSPYSQAIAPLGSVNNDSKLLTEGQNPDRRSESITIPIAGEIPQKGGSKIGLFGTAIFDGDVMVGVLDALETNNMLILRGDFKRNVFSLKDPYKPDTYISLNVSYAKKNKLKVRFENDKPIIDVVIYLEGMLVEISNNIDYKNSRHSLEEVFARQIKNEIDKTIEKCRVLKADVFKFGEASKKHFLTIKDLENYNWNSHFHEAKINTEVQLSISRLGNIEKNSPIWSSKGTK